VDYVEGRDAFALTYETGGGARTYIYEAATLNEVSGFEYFGVPTGGTALGGVSSAAGVPDAVLRVWWSASGGAGGVSAHVYDVVPRELVSQATFGQVPTLSGVAQWTTVGGGAAAVATTAVVVPDAQQYGVVFANVSAGGAGAGAGAAEHWLELYALGGRLGATGATSGAPARGAMARVALRANASVDGELRDGAVWHASASARRDLVGVAAVRALSGSGGGSGGGGGGTFVNASVTLSMVRVCGGGATAYSGGVRFVLDAKVERSAGAVTEVWLRAVDAFGQALAQHVEVGVVVARRVAGGAGAGAVTPVACALGECVRAVDGVSVTYDVATARHAVRLAFVRAADYELSAVVLATGERAVVRESANASSSAAAAVVRVEAGEAYLPRSERVNATGGVGVDDLSAVRVGGAWARVLVRVYDVFGNAIERGANGTLVVANASAGLAVQVNYVGGGGVAGVAGGVYEVLVRASVHGPFAAVLGVNGSAVAGNVLVVNGSAWATDVAYAPNCLLTRRLLSPDTPVDTALVVDVQLVNRFGDWLLVSTGSVVLVASRVESSDLVSTVASYAGAGVYSGSVVLDVAGAYTVRALVDGVAAGAQLAWQVAGVARDARFDDELSSVTLVLRVYVQAQEQGGGAQCAQVFDAATVAQLGAGAQCVLVNTTTVRVLFGAGATLAPGNVVRLLRAAGVQLARDTPATVQGALSRALPQARVTVPATVGQCGSVVFDATASAQVASGARALVARWRVTPPVLVASAWTSATSDGGAAHLLPYSSALVGKLGSPASPGTSDVTTVLRVVLPMSALAVDTTYTVEVVVANFLGDVSAVARGTVAVARDPLPTVEIDGQPVVTTRRPQRLVLVARAPAQCNATRFSVDYVWDQLSGPALNLPAITETRRSILYLPEFSLMPVLYRFRVSAVARDLDSNIVVS
jgi:hypothetical protein